MFSVAVIIPFNENTQTHDINMVSDDGNAVRETILNCDVYAGTHVVAATVLRWDNVLEQCPNAQVPWPSLLRACGQSSMTWVDVQKKCPDKVRLGRADHAEYRTLLRFKAFVTQLSNSNNLNRNDLLLFYVQSSPCPSPCTKEPVSSSNMGQSGSRGPDRSILNLIGQIMTWNNYAVVFSKVFQPRGTSKIPEPELKASLERLGRNIGLNNIFRCDGRWRTRCTSCLSNNQVTPYCYSENTQPAVIQPQPGKSPSPSRSGGRRSRSNSVQSNTGAASGGKAKRKRNRRRRRKQPGNAESLTQNELVIRDTNDGDDVGGAQGQGQAQGHFGKARRVGGRRVGKKKTGRKNNQKSKRKNKAGKKNVKKRGRGTAQWGQGPQQEWPMRRQLQRQNSNMLRGDKRRVNQPRQRKSGRRG